MLGLKRLRKSLPLVEDGTLILPERVVAFSVYRSHRRRRTIAFKVERDARVKVMAPMRSSLRAVEEVLQSRAAWILRELEQNKEIAPQRVFADGSVFPYMGHDCRLVVTRGGGKASCRLEKYKLHVHVPDDTLSDEGLRQEVKLEVMLWAKKRARVVLKRRMDLWSRRLGVRYDKMIISNPESRWGSCSVDDVIRLNWRLLLAPLPLIDYVVAHELCHVRHKNHSVRFWGFLEKSMPDYKERRAYLRRIESGLLL